MLVVIAARSGLQRSHDIFTTPDAFDQGAAKLLEECARSRTPQESERLRAEVTALRERLAYRTTGKQERMKLTSSRDIPVGATIALRRGGSQEPGLMAIVVRNDDLELAVEAEAPVASAVGEVWRVRYRIDSRVWQFDTSTVSWDGRRLVLNHGEQAHAVEHDRADRLTVQAPAAMARFPFVQATATESADMVPTDWFELVRGVVTEVSDSSLQIRSRLRVQVGERVLVVFALTPLAAGEANDAAHRGHVVAHVGRVKHRQALGEEMVMTVDLTDLADRQIDELLRLARAVAPGAGTPAGARTIQGV